MTGAASTSDFSRLSDESRLECRICWYVYDPAEGDDHYQVPPGTAFRELPDYWRCPECDGEPGNFLPIED